MRAEKFKVAGVTRYEDNIKSLSEENEDYSLSDNELLDLYDVGQEINKYEFYPEKVELIQEPENPYDENAVRVLVDGEMVGYIKKGETSQAKTLISALNYCGAEVESMGLGDYKLICEDDDGELYVERKSRYPWVHINIFNSSDRIIDDETVEALAALKQRAQEHNVEVGGKKHKQQIAGTTKALSDKKKNNTLGNLNFILGIILYVLFLLLTSVFPVCYLLAMASIGYIYYGLWLKNGKRKLTKAAWVFVLMGVAFVMFLLGMLI